MCIIWFEFPSQRLVPQGKVGAVGLAFGESLFLRKLLMPVLVRSSIFQAPPNFKVTGTLEAVGCFAAGFDVQGKRGGGGQSKRRASVKLKHQELGLVMICRRLNKLPKRKTSFARFTSPNAL